jgi:hypothetical protein
MIPLLLAAASGVYLGELSRSDSASGITETVTITAIGNAPSDQNGYRFTLTSHNNNGQQAPVKSTTSKICPQALQALTDTLSVATPKFAPYGQHIYGHPTNNSNVIFGIVLPSTMPNGWMKLSSSAGYGLDGPVLHMLTTLHNCQAG